MPPWHLQFLPAQLKQSLHKRDCNFKCSAIFSQDKKSHTYAPQNLLEPKQARETLLELAEEINSYPGK